MWRLSIGLIFGLFGAWFGYASIPIVAVDKVAGSLTVFFSIMAGLLAQVMVFTGMLVSPEKGSKASIGAVKIVLEGQQWFWLLQFAGYVACVILLTAVQMVGVDSSTSPNGLLIGKWLVGLTSGVIGWSIANALFIPLRIVSLQRMRFDIIERDLEA